MDATLTLHDGLHFSAVADSGMRIDIDGDPGPDRARQGPSPMELMIMSLGGCTAMDVISILRKKRQNVTGFEVRVHGDRATEHPKVFTDFVIEFIVRGVDIDPAAVERAIQLSSDVYCSAQAMLVKVTNIRTTYRIEPA